MRLSSICQKAEIVFQCRSYYTPVGYLVKIHSKMLKNKLSPAGAAATYAGAAATYVGAAATYVGAAATYVVEKLGIKLISARLELACWG